MEDDYGSNVHAGIEKNVRFMKCPLWKGFVIRDSLGIRPEQNFLSVQDRCPLQRMPALGSFHCNDIESDTGENIVDIGHHVSATASGKVYINERYWKHCKNVFFFNPLM